MLSYIREHFADFSSRASTFVFADKDSSTPTGITLKRGFDRIVASKRVVIVEDVMNTGGTTLDLIRTVEAHGGIVVGIVCLFRRGEQNMEILGIGPNRFLSEIYHFSGLVTYDPEKCPLCEKHVPMNIEHGHGARWLLDHPDYASDFSC